MTDKYEQTMGRPYPLGVSRAEGGINIAVPIFARKECGIMLSISKSRSIKIPFLRENRIGDLYTVYLKGDIPKTFSYQLYADEKVVKDPYAAYVNGRKKWGAFSSAKRRPSYTYQDSAFDWEGDRALQIPMHESVFYGVHVRGFTKHASSKVNAKGTFEGVVEKIPYLRELGITALMFMPFYDFDEIIVNKEYVQPQESIKPFLDEKKKTWEYKINYWGFSDAQYFAPKASYAYGADPVISCKTMIRELHKSGIECILRIYFEDKTPPSFIYEVLRYWVLEFHVDGFQLMGNHIPMDLLANDPIFCRTKLLNEKIPSEKMSGQIASGETFKNMGLMNDEFLTLARRFLKGDEDMLYTMSVQFRRNPYAFSPINYMTNYQGFTLMDLVSYDRKHNEANGEDNRDGTEYNFSWNCGVEGRTRKKTVLRLRHSQIRNALLMIFLSQGVPMLQAGDEFGFSAAGNNNPYCQDNSMTWINWKLLESNAQIYDFVRSLIRFRFRHPILHKEDELRIMDYISCGYPDLSYHGQEAWRPRFENYNRHLGVLYCGKYARKERNKEDDFIYITYNMHWIEHEFAFPKLPKGLKWYDAINSQESTGREELPIKQDDEKFAITVAPRTIRVFVGR